MAFDELFDEYEKRRAAALAARRAETSREFRVLTEQIDRRIRAFNPFPVAFSTLDGENLRIYEANFHTDNHAASPGTLLRTDTELVVACGEHSTLSLLTVQMPGKKVMAVKDLLNGLAGKLCPGLVLGLS